MTDSTNSDKTAPITVDAILAIKDIPVIAINQSSLITFINDAFITEYGYTQEELLFKPVRLIMPKYLRDAHKIGFSRFLTTEKPKILGIPLPLEILYKDGAIIKAEHFIVGERKNNEWRFAATITRRI